MRLIVSITGLALLSTTTEAFHHTFQTARHGRFTSGGRVDSPLYGFTTKEASLAGGICNPFGDEVCDPASRAGGDAIESVAKAAPDLVPAVKSVSNAVGESVVGSVKGIKGMAPGNIKIKTDLDFSTLKPGPQSAEGLAKLKSNFAGMADMKGVAVSPGSVTPKGAGVDRLLSNFQGGGGGAQDMPMPHFPPLPSTFSLLEVQAWMGSLDEVTKNYLFGGLLFASFVVLAASKEDTPSPAPAPAPVAATATAATTATATPPNISPVEAPAPAPTPTPAPAAPKKMGKPGDPQETLNESRLNLMAMEQRAREQELKTIKEENEMMKKKLQAMLQVKPATTQPKAAAKPKRSKAQKPKIDASMMNTLRDIDGPNAQAPAITKAPEPVKAPEPMKAPEPVSDPLAAAKAAAKTQVQASASPAASSDDWSSLSDAALKRKTVVQLKEFITSKGNKPNAKAVKADLIKQAKGLMA